MMLVKSSAVNQQKQAALAKVLSERILLIKFVVANNAIICLLSTAVLSFT